MPIVFHKTGVYCIRNRLDGKRYIGSASISLIKRIRDHWAELAKNRHANRYLQRAYNKYGRKMFVASVVERCQPKFCVNREQYWMDFYKAAVPIHGYNISPTAGSQLGMVHSKETRDKIAAMNRLRDPESFKRQAEKMRGRTLKSEHVAKISAGNRIAWKYGKRKDYRHSDETKAKLSRFFRGRKISEEHRLKIVAALLRRPPRSEETKAKIGAGNAIALKGKKLSDEHRANLRAGHKARKMRLAL